MLKYFWTSRTTVIKRSEPFTSAAMLLVQRHFDDEKVILELADRRLGHRMIKAGQCRVCLPSKILCKTLSVNSRRACAIEAENCVLHNDIHIGNILLRDGSHSPVIIDFGQADIREPEANDEKWMSVAWRSLDARYMGNRLMNSQNGPWKWTVTPYEMSVPHYKDPLVFNEYVEDIPEDFRRVTFERVFCIRTGTGRESVYYDRGFVAGLSTTRT
ncbi:hypothetical protein IW262DRAFT_175592 [Armillaria fumosa]|nr:hypothetical protein IW262DRAFT_175592 [Armillaria fumosa]